MSFSLNPSAATERLDQCHVKGNSADQITLQGADRLSCQIFDLDRQANLLCPQGAASDLAGDKDTPTPLETSPATTAAIWPKLAPAQGSYYHKVISPYGHFVGISATVKLGQPIEDKKRMSGPLGKPLDGFGAYLGGNVYGRHEVDAGMTWSITRDASGHVDYKDKAWRPFWRDQSWHNAPAQSRFYWQPGDTVNIRLTEVGKDKLKLTIADAGPHPKRSFATVFDASGFDPELLASFKRVDSIDQVHREGKSVLPTRARLLGVNWLSTALLSKDEAGKIVESPLLPADIKIIEPLPDHISARSSAEEQARGGEHIDIFGVVPGDTQKSKF